MCSQLSGEKYEEIKKNIREWILSINEKESIPAEIEALNFGLFEPYGIELIGANAYDVEDDDWACEEDFIPRQRMCPNIDVSEEIEWEDFLNTNVQILKELTEELKKLDIFRVKHITTGFCDGDLVVVK